MSGRSLSGNASAFAAAALFGASVVATRVVVGTIPPLSLAVLRFGQGGLILLLYLLIVRPGTLRVQVRDVPYLALLGAVLFTVFPITFNVGLKFTEASRGALMLSTMPLWSAWLARIARSERLSLRQISGIILTLCGVAGVLTERGLSWRGGSPALVGDLLMLVTALSGALYGVLAQKMLRKYRAITVTTYAMLTGTCLLVPAASIEGLSHVLTGIDLRTVWLIPFPGNLRRRRGLPPLDLRLNPPHPHSGSRLRKSEPHGSRHTGSRPPRRKTDPPLHRLLHSSPIRRPPGELARKNHPTDKVTIRTSYP